MKKLYILRPVRGHELWEPWYDKCFGVVVRAKDVHEARKIASHAHGDEGMGAWLSKESSTCKELKAAGKSEEIIKDFASA